MRLARTSIAMLALAMALIAVDLTPVRNPFLNNRPLMVSSRCGLLMINVLAIAAYRRRERGGTRPPFLRGFFAFGSAAALLCQAGVVLLPGGHGPLPG